MFSRFLVRCSHFENVQWVCDSFPSHCRTSSLVPSLDFPFSTPHSLILPSLRSLGCWLTLLLLLFGSNERPTQTLKWLNMYENFASLCTLLSFTTVIVIIIILRISIQHWADKTMNKRTSEREDEKKMKHTQNVGRERVLWHSKKFLFHFISHCSLAALVVVVRVSFFKIFHSSAMIQH